MRRPTLRTEAQMAEAVAYRFRRSAREIRVGSCVFDVVAYDKGTRIFKVFECKRVSDARRIGQTFGQAAAYVSIVSENGFAFVDALSRKLYMRFGRWMEGTNNGTEIKVQFYVALPDSGCENLDLLKSLKRSHPNIGIIRVKPNGNCREYIKDQRKRDYELAKARPVTIKIFAPQHANK